MEPNHDIYRKEQPPPFKKRRRRSSREGLVPDNVPSARLDSAPRDDKAMQPAHPGTTTPPFGHRSRTTRSTDRRTRRIWMVLVTVFGIYMVFLAISILRGKRHVPAGGEQAQATNSLQTAASPTGAPVAAEARFQIADRITEWNRVPDCLLDTQSLLDQGLIDQAEAKLGRALENTPHVSRLQIKLSQVLIQKKQFERARALLVDVLESNPEDTAARLMLAGVLDRQTNYPASLAVAKWILETDPSSIEANEVAANAYLNTDRKGMAVPHLRKLALLQRDKPVVQNKLAVTYTQMGEYVKAIQLFNEILANNAADPMTYYNLVVCYAKMSDADQAVETLTRAQSLFGKDFVNTWLQSSDFDSIRKEPIFIALQTSGSKPGETNATVATQPTETNAPATTRPTATNASAEIISGNPQ